MLLNDPQLDATREKLRLLEESYEEVRNEAEGDKELREAELESLGRFIKQLKEEIIRYEAGADQSKPRRRVLNDVELINTRRKLSDLERMYEAHERGTDEDEHVRDLSNQSLKKTINQLKEEIIWTEAHQPTPRAQSRS